MERKFIKKSGPMGTPPPRPSPAGPGAGPTTAPTPPTSPPAGLGTTPPGPTPPHPPEGVTEHPGGSGGPPGADLAPRTTPDPMAGKEQVPTDVSIDAATGHVTIKKPGVNITVAKYDKNNPPAKISHLPEHAQHIWVEAFNNAFDEYDGDEERAFATAWAAVKKSGYKTKKDSSGKFKKKAIDVLEHGNEDEGNFVKEVYEDTRHEVDPEEAYQEAYEYGYEESGAYRPHIPPKDFFHTNEEYDAFIEGFRDGTKADIDDENVDPDIFDDFERFAKKATHQDWIDFKANDNEPQYGDWKEETTYSKEYHDNPFSSPANRLSPPVYQVRAQVPEFMNPRNIAYVLQTSTMLDVDINGNTLTVNDVASPLSLITELTSYGIEAEVVGDDLTKYDQGIEDFKLGQKVALLGDYEDMNYFYNPNVPPAQAMIMGINGDKVLLENDQWGRFEARVEEIGHVR